MKSFYVLVPFTDADGFHDASTVVNLPYDSDEQIANALSMIRYGIITERAPEPAPAPVATPAPEPTPAVAQDDPKTEFFDARTSDGKFVAEGTPVESSPVSDEVAEQAPKQPAKAPAKKGTRRTR